MSVAAEQPRLRWLGRCAFGLIVAIVLARCLMLVSIREADATAGSDVPAGPGAAVAVALDWLAICTVPMLIVRRLFDDRSTLRFTLVHALLAALAVWTLASVAWADDKFAALVGGADVCAAAAIFWSVSQLVRRWDQFRVVAGLAVAVLLANVAQGAIFTAVEFPSMREYWQQNREKIFEDRGWRADDYVAQRFEKKVLAGEVLGFSASPNTMGAICVMGALVALGAAGQRTADRDAAGWSGLLWIAAASCAYPLAHSGSKASWAALLLGVIAIVAWRFARRLLDAHRALVFAVGCVGVGLAALGVIAYGLTRGGLPSDSLNFRWRYWAGAWPLVVGHPVAGVGWANFGSHYLAHRLPPAAEEIQDPHDLFVRWATELGLVGLALGIAWLGLWAYRAARAPRRANRSAGGGCRAIGVLLACAAALALNALCTIDLGLLSTGDGANYVVIEVLKRAVLFGAIGLAMCLTTLAVRRDQAAFAAPAADEADARRPLDYRAAPRLAARAAGSAYLDPFVDARPAPWLAAAAVVAVAALVVQSTIDIAFFDAGPLTLAAALMGASLGIAADDRPARHGSRSFVALICSGVVALAALVVIVVPVTIAESAARAGDRFGLKQPARAIELYESAATWSVASNWSYAERAARVAMAANDPRATGLLDRVVAADPSRSIAYLNRARWRASRPGADAALLLADYAEGLARNPNEVDVRVEYADALERLGRPREASEQLFRALADDDALDEAEPERLDLRAPGTRARLQQRAVRLQNSSR